MQEEASESSSPVPHESGQSKTENGRVYVHWAKVWEIAEGVLSGSEYIGGRWGRGRNAPLSIHSFTGAESEGAGTDDQVVPQEHTLYWF